MSRTRRWLFMGALLCMAAIAAWCWLDSGETRPLIEKTEFLPANLRVHFGERISLTKLAITDGKGGLVAEQRYSQVERKSLDVPLSWSPGSRYTLQVDCEEGRALKTLTAPRGPAPGLWVRLLVPYQGEKEFGDVGAYADRAGSSAVLAQKGFTTCALLVKNHLSQAGELSGRIALPRRAVLDRTALPPEARLKENGSRRELVISGVNLREQQSLALVFRLSLPDQVQGEIRASLTFRIGRTKRAYTRKVNLHVLGPEDMASLIAVRGVWLPTGKDGYYDRRKQEDTIYYKSRLLRDLTRWLGLTDGRISYWLPFTYQSLALKNLSTYDLGLLINSRIEYLNKPQVPEQFQPPNVFSGSMRDQSVTVSLGLGPGQEAKAVLPVFVNSAPRAGQYRRVLTIYPMGGQEPLARLEYPMYVRGLNLTALGFTAASCLLSLAAFAVLAVRFRPLMAGLKVRWVVIVALFGALTFVGVNLPLKVFGSLIYGLLGPFSVLVLGFFNDLLYFTLLVAVVRLVPRPGVVSLITLVRYLLSVMLLGGFHVSDFLYLGTSLAVKESAFWLAGVTRKGDEFSWSWGSTLFLALCLGLGDAYLNASSLYIHMVLFRLYFADWYIWLNVVINGLVYTMAGVYLGRSFSRRLVWAEE